MPTHKYISGDPGDEQITAAQDIPKNKRTANSLFAVKQTLNDNDPGDEHQPSMPHHRRSHL